MVGQSSNYNHWSIGIKGGLDYYRIKPDEGKSDWSKSEMHRNNVGWVLPAVTIDYTVNPYYGFGIEGGWYTYNREGLKASTMDFVLTNEFNLSNLLAPTRQGFWKKSTFYGTAALGVAFYQKKPQGDSKYKGVSPVGVLGLEYNYNFGSVVALIIEGQYRSYFVDNLGIAPRTTGNNDGFVANIGLRFKFHKSDKSHVRDASVKDYYTELYTTEKPDMSAYDAKIIALEEQINGLNGHINTNSGNIRNLQEQVTKLNNREIQEAKKEQTAVLTLEDKIKHLENQLSDKASSTDVVEIAFSEILFNTNSASLAKESEYALSRILQTIKNNQGKKIRIFGYTDNTGSLATNQRLSQQRAEAVKNYLVSNGVSASSIVEVKGMGPSNPVADNATVEGRAQNRRVSFVIE